MASFQISLPSLKRNAEILRQVTRTSGGRIVLALKGFSTWPSFHAFKEFLQGCCASGLWEAELAKKYFGGEILVYSPAYEEHEMDSLLEFASHIDFNSLSQWHLWEKKVKAHPRFQEGSVKCGLRVNPLCSTGHTPLYDPCIPGSRLGIPPEQLKHALPDGISGIHFHTLCEQDADDLEKTLFALEKEFGAILNRPEITWLNMGGGHWITKPSYNREKLISLIKLFREKYNLEVWLEPGEAAAIHTGVLRCRVLDVFESLGYNHAILDVSASAHMPDVLEMPYRPDVFLVGQGNHTEKKIPSVTFPGECYTKAGEPGENRHTYRLGAPTCLAGDVMGDFSFPRELIVGDELVFDDMAHYTMVKTTFFNGVRHPDIELVDEEGQRETVRKFSFHDFEKRLG